MDKPVMLKLLVSILDRGRGARAVELLRQKHLHFHFACLGHGTANSSLLDYLGLGETEKDVLLTLLPAPLAHSMLEELAEELQLRHPGRGVVFCMPLSGVNGAVSQLMQREPIILPEGREMDMEHRHELILAVVDQGGTDTVMDAARGAGARGGTVLHARRVGYEDLEPAAGLQMQPEKEIVAILTGRAEKTAVMQAVNRAAGIRTESRGVLLALPVDEVAGLSLLNGGDEP